MASTTLRRTQEPGRSASAAQRPAEPLLGDLVELLALRPDDLLVQLGCASPDRLCALANHVPLRYQPLVVDPSPERLAPFAAIPQLRFVAMDPLRFAVFPMHCDRILLEESLLAGSQGPDLARGLFARLRPEGRLLAVPAGPSWGGGRSPGVARRRSGRDVCMTLKDAGFDVRRHAADLVSGPVDLVLAVKSAPGDGAPGRSPGSTPGFPPF